MAVKSMMRHDFGRIWDDKRDGGNLWRSLRRRATRSPEPSP